MMSARRHSTHAIEVQRANVHRDLDAVARSARARRAQQSGGAIVWEATLSPCSTRRYSARLRWT
jgi:hypothetical protein